MAPQMFAAPAKKRATRTPTFAFQLRTKPFQLQPFAMCPVLPGETMRQILWQSRCVSDPLRNPLIGWHKEYYWFYVKLRDLDGRDDFVDMFLDFDKDLSSYEEAATTRWYNYANSIPWAKLCTKRIVEEYFRDEGEDWLTGAGIDNVPLVKTRHNEQSWLQSAILKSALTALDVTIDVNATPDPDTVSAKDISEALRQWEFLRTHGLTQMSYEDYLRTYGVRLRAEETFTPELLRYTSEWTYPTNTIDPTDGSPTSAVSWAISARADKDRFFKEAGFIVGLTCTRPKTYRSGQDGAAVGLLNNAFAWLPAILSDDPATSLREVAGGTGPLGTICATGGTDDYVVDIKDLFVRGDQFINFTVSGNDNSFVALPTADLAEKSYATSTDAANLFVDNAGSAILLKEDGIANIVIDGSVVDTTPESNMIQI